MASGTDQIDSLAAGDLAFDAGNRLARIQSLWTGFRAIHYRVAAIQLEGVVERAIVILLHVILSYSHLYACDPQL